MSESGQKLTWDRRCSVDVDVCELPLADFMPLRWAQNLRQSVIRHDSGPDEHGVTDGSQVTGRSTAKILTLSKRT
jgi:hypothetical protein